MRKWFIVLSACAILLAVPQATQAAQAVVMPGAGKLPPFSATTLDKTKLHPIRYLTSFKHQINKRIVEITLNPSVYKNADWKNGLIPDGNHLIVTERFKGDVVDQLRIGDPVATVKAKLGKPSFVEEDFFFYKTAQYYIGFKGRKTVEQAVFAATPKLKDADILKKLVTALNANDDLATVVADDASAKAFFDDNGHVHGGGWYAYAEEGIEAVQFEDNTITVFNNFEGKLYITFSNSKYQVVYENIDSKIQRMQRSVYGYLDIRNRMKTEGLLSPSKKFTALYEWITSDSQYFIIRSNDNSAPDLDVRAMVQNYWWLNDSFLLATDFISQRPIVIPIRSGSGAEPIDVFKAVGIQTGDSMDEIKITDIKANSFVVKYDGKTATITFAVDKNNKLRLSKSK